MSHTNWEVGDGPNHLVYPQWLVPIENTRWAPLEGQFYAVLGTPAEHQELNVNPWKRNPPRMQPDPAGPIAAIWKIYNQSKVEPDFMKRTQFVWKMIKIHVDQGPFFTGTVGNYPQVIVAKTDLRNIPRKENLAQGGFVNPWVHPTPAVYDPECWFWDSPAQHTT
jgi:peptide/nickel transport system substrate-binding protein